MSNNKKKRLIWFILLALITSFSLQTLLFTESSSKVDDFSFSVPNLSAQDTFWPGNSSEWPEVAPETQGLNSGKISEILEFIENNSTNIQSIIIVRNGYLLFEEYLWNYQIYRNLAGEKEYPGGRKIVPQYSGTKSVISLLIGIALQEGFLDNVNQTLYEFYADIWEPSFTNSTLKKNITIEQLLTHNSGLNGGDANYPPNGKTLIELDCIDWALDRVPLKYNPGQTGVYEYSNDGPNLLSGIIENVTGKSTEEFAQEYLFTPLGISEDEYVWWHDDKNVSYGGYGLECTPKVQAKFGILCLNDGKWDGTQIVEPNFMEDAFTQQTSAFGMPYGYLFYIRDDPFDAYFTIGAGGQNIYILPEYNLVVGFTASNGGPYEQIISDYILQFTAPEWDQIPEDQLIREGDSFFYNVNGSNVFGVEYSIDDTVNFNISSEGIITNSLSLSAGVYPLEIRAYNPYNNSITATITIRVAEDRAPEWDEIPEDQTILEGNSLFYDVNASNVFGVEYSIDDTVNFAITPEGIITNSLNLSVGVYSLEIRAYNPYNNSITATINIRVISVSTNGIGIPGFDITMIFLTIFCASALLIIRRKKTSKY